MSEYLEHEEPGIALEHLLYMIHEPPLTISPTVRKSILEAAEIMGMSGVLVEYGLHA